MFTLKMFTPSDEEFFMVHDMLHTVDVPVTRSGEWAIASAPSRFTLEMVIRWADRWNVMHSRTIEDDGVCERCKWDTAVPHNNCLYNGNAIGHSKAHCTADACY
jgi:hypothetical protein